MSVAVDIEIDLRHRFGPVRDQGRRPTCLAFAASDSHAGIRAGWEPLSCEFAFYNAQRRAGRSPNQGALLGAMLDTLRLDGQPVEACWPYLEADAVQVANWLPPATIGDCFGRNGNAGGADLADVRSRLATGQPVVVLTMLSASFFTPVDGIVDEAPGELPEPSQRHALVAVGIGRILGIPATLVRNSWGATWGTEGHAWLTDRYLSPRLFATAAFLEEVDVSTRAIAA
ncbi:C1 family peptidase [Erythrobacter sp. SN021]|uniref:C1 family peptidase n=1 Tax=Erythrobacter sp. SN021 TaxID=2912574 RepID=UPI001F3F6633|nr:C1 family peptidase [Erythrobacter sp. SN021]MCF8883424.1 C1 family peptidase [Erythrobacter sp. SN021]